MAEAVPRDAFPRDDGDVARFSRDLGLPGIADVHVHFLPDRLQAAVWAYFDRLVSPPWPVVYRQDETARLARLGDLGVVRHTALAYAHKPGMLAWLNGHTLALAATHPQVVPTFTLYPEDGVDAAVADAVARGGQVAKVHLQVSRFHATDARLDGVWQLLAQRRVPVVLHASAVYGVEGGTEFCGADKVAALLDAHPSLLVVVAHLGVPDVADFVTLAEQATTLRLDTTMALTDPPFFAPVERHLLPRLAALHDRLLFGSDFPTIPHSYAAAVSGLAALELDAAGLRRVLHDNSVGLLAGVH